MAFSVSATGLTSYGDRMVTYTFDLPTFTKIMVEEWIGGVKQLVARYINPSIGLFQVTVNGHLSFMTSDPVIGLGEGSGFTATYSGTRYPETPGAGQMIFKKLEKHQAGSNTFVLTKRLADGSLQTETVNYTYP